MFIYDWVSIPCQVLWVSYWDGNPITHRAEDLLGTTCLLHFSAPWPWLAQESHLWSYPGQVAWMRGRGVGRLLGERASRWGGGREPVSLFFSVSGCCHLSVVCLHHYHHRVCVWDKEKGEGSGSRSGKAVDGSQFKQQLSSSFQVKILGLVHQAVENQLNSTDAGHGPFRLEGRDNGLVTTLAGFPHSLEASLIAQMVKNLPAVQETRVRSLGREDPLEKGKATHSNILPGVSQGQGSLADDSPLGSQRVGHDFGTKPPCHRPSGAPPWLDLSQGCHRRSHHPSP